WVRDERPSELRPYRGCTNARNVDGESGLRVAHVEPTRRVDRKPHDCRQHRRRRGLATGDQKIAVDLESLARSLWSLRNQSCPFVVHALGGGLVRTAFGVPLASRARRDERDAEQRHEWPKPAHAHTIPTVEGYPSVTLVEGRCSSHPRAAPPTGV